MELDRLSTHLLVKLSQMGEATASELKDALGVEASQSIHYRMDEKLIPAGLVYEHPQRREQPGSRKAARVYEIEPEGREWVENHGHKVTLTDIDQAEKEIQRLNKEIQDLSHEVSKLRDWRQEQAGQTGGMSTRLTELGNRVEELEELTMKHEQRDYGEIWDHLHDLSEQAGQLDTRLDNAAQVNDVSQVERGVKKLTNRVDSLDKQIEDLQSSHNDWSQWGNRAEDRIRTVEQHTSRNLLGRLRWLLFGD